MRNLVTIVLVNAVYHRSYEEREPIEVRVLPDEILVQSFPGPDRAIPMEELRAGRPVGRRYRNRRIGEFLKELELSEGRNTGIPTIQRAMADNGSSAARFETDEDRTYLLVRLPLRPPPQEPAGGTTTQVAAHVGELNKVLKKNALNDLCAIFPAATSQVTAEVTAQVVFLCRDPRSARQIMAELGLRHWKTFQANYLVPLIQGGVLARTIPDKPKSRLQKYRLTAAADTWLRTNHP